MKLELIRIENFRSFVDQTISLSDYICLVGPNGSGKSTVLSALNIFFRNSTSSTTNVVTLSEEDFHLKDTSKPVRISLTFSGLSENAQEDIGAYYRQGKLVISAIASWDKVTGSAEVRQYGSRLIMQEFIPFFEAIEKKAKVAELKQIYSSLMKSHPELPEPGPKEAMETALRSYEEAHSEKCKLVESPSQFYGWSKGINHLRKYIQWIFIPAVKDVTSEQDEGRATALGQLLERTIRSKVNFEGPIAELKKELADKYQKIIEKEQHVLEQLQGSLTSRLQGWTHPSTNVNLRWHYNEDKSISIQEPLARVFVGEHDFMGELARLGHGLQRAFLVSLLQELADVVEENSPTLLLGFEEPELYQHPPQAKHMSSLLQRLSAKTWQVILTTHSPYFISGRSFESIRMVRDSRQHKCSLVSDCTHEHISKKLGELLGDEPRSTSSMMANIEQIMQPSQSEMFFSQTVILVEGIEDIAFLSTQIQLLGLWEEFRRFGCHFVVADGKTNMSRFIVIAQKLSIPIYSVFDADADDKQEQLERHKKDNLCLLALCGHQNADPLPKNTFWESNITMWASDIGKEIRESTGIENWNKAEKKVREIYGYQEGVKKKNSILLSGVLEELWRNGVKSKPLEQTVQSILGFASRVQN